MKTQTAYCSACDHEVRVVLTDEPSHEGQANLTDAEVVCLEIGDQCTGNLCPIGATSPTVMAARLVRNGLQTVLQPLVSLECERCTHVTTHVLIERSYATCTDCGATHRREFVQDN